MTHGVLFDVDGTLVDSNYWHVVAWSDAFRANGYDVAMARIHGLIGQGSERLVETIVGRVDSDVVSAHEDFYAPQLHRLTALPGAGDLLRRAKQDGRTVVLATSAGERDVDYLRAVIDADDAIDHVTTKDDADASKPAPDILTVALDATGLRAADCVFVGDSVWDVRAAAAIGMPCVCVLSGGIDAAVLRAAGSDEVYDDAADLLANYQDSALKTDRR